MERLTLDRQGARRGELSAASLQLGENTIAIQRIATMSIEDLSFQPYETEANKQTQSIYGTLSVVFLFTAMLAAVWWWFSPNGQFALIAVAIAALSTLIGLYLGAQSARMRWKMRKSEAYFQLLIGTSDGRESRLVDDNREVLVKIRNIIKHKMDTEDRRVTGRFDLEADTVDLDPPEQPLRLVDETDAPS